ncbi:MAG TPA: RNA polymerase sigma factor [Candidatus Omnitrophota bacterium]|nr:RNA polymerase sigma factor [Candidatus Omnitrophota bacterium]
MAAAAADELAAHREAVRGFLTRLLKDSGLAEDLAQESLIRATRAADGMRGEAAPRTWLIAVAFNLARDHFRRAGRQPRFSDLDAAADIAAAENPEHDVLKAEMSSCILGHIDRLPARQRDAVLMHHFAGLTHAEIAAALAVTEGNARVLLHRGLAALRRSLGQECTVSLGDDIPCERR